MKQLLNVFRVYENRYLKKINTIDISDLTDKQVAHATKLIDDAPGKVWEYQPIKDSFYG